MSHFDVGTINVNIKDGNIDRTVTITQEDQFFTAQNSQITIQGKGVFFQPNTRTAITAPSLFSGWNCGTKSENHRCGRVRNGHLLWLSKYVVVFYGKFFRAIDNLSLLSENFDGINTLTNFNLFLDPATTTTFKTTTNTYNSTPTTTTTEKTATTQGTVCSQMYLDVFTCIYRLYMY